MHDVRNLQVGRGKEGDSPAQRMVPAVASQRGLRIVQAGRVDGGDAVLGAGGAAAAVGPNVGAHGIERTGYW